MALEQLTNKAASTLSAAITSGATSLTVASAAAFPTNGNFRVIVDNEIMLVTAVSGTTFTVTRGAESTTAASHASGAAITHVLTAASLRALGLQRYRPENGIDLFGTPGHDKTEQVSVAASATQTLMNHSDGPGYVSTISIQVNSTDFRARERSVLSIYRDGEATPSITGEVRAIFGADDLPPAFLTKHIGAFLTGNDANYVLTLMIPYASSIKIDITNGSSTATMTVWSNVQRMSGVAVDWDRYTHLYGAAHGNTAVAQYAEETLLDVSGRGLLHGLILRLIASGSTPTMLEGNIKIYLDGAGSPSLEWSGTEDYFRNGFYFEGGTLRADHVGTIKVDATSHIYTAYRFHVPDPIPFATHCKVTWSNGQSGQGTAPGTSDCLAFSWYYLDS